MADPPRLFRTTQQLKRFDYGPRPVNAATLAYGAGYAPLNSPHFTGDPQAPTAAPGDADASIATTAFVAAAVTTAPNKTITLSGDIAGSGTTAIATTLRNVNANIGTFQGITVNAKGQVTAAVSQTPWTTSLGGTGAATFPIGTGTNNAAVGMTTALLMGAGTSPVASSPYWGAVNDGGLCGFINGPSGSPYILMGHAYGTPALPAALPSGQPLGQLYFVGYGASAWSGTRGFIQVAATENWSNTAQGTRLDINLTPTGGTATANALSLSGGGNLTLTGGLAGTATNNNAAAGNVGEYVSSDVAYPGSGISNGVLTNVTSISLTAGDWDVEGNVGFQPAGTTTLSGFNVSVSLASANTDSNDQGRHQMAYAGPAGQLCIFPTGKRRVSLAATTPVYLVAAVNFAVSTCTAWGFIAARRAR